MQYEWSVCHFCCTTFDININNLDIPHEKPLGSQHRDGVGCRPGNFQSIIKLWEVNQGKPFKTTKSSIANAFYLLICPWKVCTEIGQGRGRAGVRIPIGDILAVQQYMVLSPRYFLILNRSPNSRWEVARTVRAYLPLVMREFFHHAKWYELWLPLVRGNR